MTDLNEFNTRHHLPPRDPQFHDPGGRSARLDNRAGPLRLLPPQWSGGIKIANYTLTKIHFKKPPLPLSLSASVAI